MSGHDLPTQFRRTFDVAATVALDGMARVMLVVVVEEQAT